MYCLQFMSCDTAYCLHAVTPTHLAQHDVLFRRCRCLELLERCSCRGFGVWGLGFGVWGLGFGVWGSNIGVSLHLQQSYRVFHWQGTYDNNDTQHTKSVVNLGVACASVLPSLVALLLVFPALFQLLRQRVLGCFQLLQTC